MKRALYLLLPLSALLAVLFLAGNRLVAGLLDTQLPPLLESRLGLPVHLAPTRVRLSRLTVTSDKLVLGEPADPAVAAGNLKVRLSLSSLLERELRFDFAGAGELDLRPERWPAGDGPPAEDFRFLEPWLPQALQVASARYLAGDDFTYRLQDLGWRRRDDGSAGLEWREARAGGDLEVAASLASLDDLLGLRRAAVDLRAAVAGNPDTVATAAAIVEPGQSEAYTLRADIALNGVRARLEAGHAQSWRLPSRSEIRLQHLPVENLRAFLAGYAPPGKARAGVDWLDAELPRLTLPDHRGRVYVEELALRDERAEELGFTFVTGAAGIVVRELTAAGPTGRLDGGFTIASAPDGWAVEVKADLRPRKEEAGIGADLFASRWLWSDGAARLSGSGATWGELLYALSGEVSLKGHYRGEVNTPLAVSGRLDSARGRFALENLSVTVGEGELHGSAELSGDERRQLTVSLSGTGLHLDFLAAGEAERDARPGLAIPQFDRLPELDLALALDVSDLRVPGLALARARATLQRTPAGGSLAVTAAGGGGELALELAADVDPQGEEQLRLHADFKRVNLTALFGQPDFFYSRSTGSLRFTSRGEGAREIFAQLRGTAEITVELRPDNDWQRAGTERESVTFTGDAAPVLDGERITGLSIENIDVQSLEQNLTGTVSVVDGRDPALIADLRSNYLNIGHIRDVAPAGEDEIEAGSPLKSLRELPSGSISLQVGKFDIAGVSLKELALQAQTAPGRLTLEQLDFDYGNGQLQSRGSLAWQGEKAALEAAAALSGVNLDQFLILDPQGRHVPVSGSLKLQSEGDAIAELATNLSGFVDLSATGEQPAAADRRRLAMDAQRTPGGMEARITELHWGETELVGRLRYRDGSPPRLDIEIDEGTLSLLPWEGAQEAPPAGKTSKSGAVLDAAQASANFVGDFLTTPLRLLGPEEKTAPGERIFSNEPLPLDALGKIDLSARGNLQALRSSQFTATGLEFEGSLEGGRLSVTAGTGGLNGGSGTATLEVDSSQSPPAMSLTSTFSKVRGLAGGDTFPRSGFVSLHSAGASTAALAAGLDGIIYLEAGRGPFDYTQSRLLTADIATSVFTTLMPGIDRELPELQCAATLGLFEDGIGVTPYGFAARTNIANLLGRLQVDLGRERLELSFDSRSREGVGLSVGNVFSNTIRVEGSLSNPKVVPNTTGLIWRGWAAVLTGGLSVIGESVLKRVLASDNPCDSIKELIREDLCPKNALAASSPMVCPETTAAAGRAGAPPGPAPRK